MAKKQRKLALSLRGGGAKCAAYLGVIRAFEEEGINIDMIIGSSGGAVTGGGYAFHKDVDIVLDHFQQYTSERYFGMTDLLKELRLVSDDKSIAFARELVGKMQIENADIQLFIQATNLTSGENTIFDKGEAAIAGVASSAVPWLVKPITIDGEQYIDGDYSSGFANSFLKSKGAEVVIGMCVNGGTHATVKTDLVSKISRPIDIMTARIRQLDQKLDPVDYLIEDLAGDFTFTDFKKAHEIADHGYEVAQGKLTEIKDLLF